MVWLEIPLAKSALVPIAAEAGFEYHHAESEYVSYDAPARGGVLHPAVCDALHRRRGGGAQREGRDTGGVGTVPDGVESRSGIQAAGGARCIRENILWTERYGEVLEETGVHARFESLACFRHWHGYRYDKSDIYFVCRLSALSTEITRQEEEIAECPLDAGGGVLGRRFGDTRLQ